MSHYSRARQVGRRDRGHKTRCHVANTAASFTTFLKSMQEDFPFALSHSDSS